jgi:hypothetical protein
VTEKKFSSSVVREFAREPVWQAIVEDILSRITIMCEESDNTDPYKDPTTIARNQGGKNFGLWIVDLPKLMLEEAEAEEALNKAKREEKEENEY